mmetsp:Transcript_9298/g.27595  ORF Transcript_9298/g.27595 Transcript_9298/m.27595 type:complete len:284 (-) Transcript_9298:1396-2247(-)
MLAIWPWEWCSSSSRRSVPSFNCFRVFVSSRISSFTDSWDAFMARMDLMVALVSSLTRVARLFTCATRSCTASTVVSMFIWRLLRLLRQRESSSASARWLLTYCSAARWRSCAFCSSALITVIMGGCALSVDGLRFRSPADIPEETRWAPPRRGALAAGDGTPRASLDGDDAGALPFGRGTVTFASALLTPDAAAPTLLATSLAADTAGAAPCTAAWAAALPVTTAEAAASAALETMAAPLRPGGPLRAPPLLAAPPPPPWEVSAVPACVAAALLDLRPARAR